MTNSAARPQRWQTISPALVGAQLQLDQRLGVHGTCERSPFVAKGGDSPARAAGTTNIDNLRENASVI